MITEFTPFLSLLGGVLIGLSAVVLMATIGRIAGISGIIGGLFTPNVGEALWRVAFLAGLMAAPVIYVRGFGQLPDFAVTSNLYQLVAGGLLVGFGAIVGSGCTSGHGICGLSRISRRSMVAVAVFMVSAMVTVLLLRHLM